MKPRRRSSSLTACLGAAGLLTGCSAPLGFWVRVSTLSGDEVLGGQVLTVGDHGASYGEPVTPALVPVPGARVTCEGCREATLGADGRFGLSVPGDAQPKSPIRVHVRASGYKPVDIDVPTVPFCGEAGCPTMTVVLEREGPA